MPFSVNGIFCTLVLLVLWRTEELTEACSCAPVHPQQAFCNADVGEYRAHPAAAAAAVDVAVVVVVAASAAHLAGVCSLSSAPVRAEWACRGWWCRPWPHCG